MSYLGGVLTILSPCVLPVVPFVFLGSDRSFKHSGFPMLIGMGLSFSVLSALSVAGGRLFVQANQIGRGLALTLFALLGLSLVFPSLAEKLSRPFVRFGGWLQQVADRNRQSVFSSVLLGASIGLLWAPCAGPILGLVLTGAALGKSIHTTFFLLFSFAMGAATSLAFLLFAGNKVLSKLKRGLGAEEWIRKAAGVVVISVVIMITFGLDTSLLARLSYVNTNRFEQVLVDRWSPVGVASIEGAKPSVDGAVEWINSPSLGAEELRGKVVLVDFWTYSCINCLRSLPYIKDWYKKYKSQGLVVIGVHSPEFAFEHDLVGVRRAVEDLKIEYPVAVDNSKTIWTAFKNQYWPAHFLIDRDGRIRYHHFGEGNYGETEHRIQMLLNKESVSNLKLEVASSSKVSPSIHPVSPETYLGYLRQRGLLTKESETGFSLLNQAHVYNSSDFLDLNQWSLSGKWLISSEMALLESQNGGVNYKFQARDLHLVMGAGQGNAKRFRVTLDGQPPGPDHGEDTDAQGNGQVQFHRLYRLIRQRTSQNRMFHIEFLDSGVEVYAFTFGE